MSLAESLLEALRLREKMRADGATEQDLAIGFERVVREAWPKGRVWTYTCDDCNDTGWISMVCTKGRRCNGVSTRTDHAKDEPGKHHRLCFTDPESDYEHDYVIPCFCAAGVRHTAQQPPDAPQADLERAAKSRGRRDDA